MDNIDELKSNIPDIVLKLCNKFPYAYIWCMKKNGLTIDMTLKKESINRTPDVIGTVISIFNGEEVIEYTTDSLDYKKIAKLAEQVIKEESAHQFRGEYNKDKEFLSKNFYTDEEIPLKNLDNREKFASIKDAYEYVKTLDVLNSNIFYREVGNFTLFIDPYKVLYQSIPRVIEYLFLYKNSKDGIKNMILSRSGTGGFEIADMNKHMIDELYIDLNLVCDSKKLVPGEYTITGNSQLTGLIAHEAFGHGVEMDTMYKGRAKSINYFNKKVGNKLVTISDNPMSEKSYASYFFDDEGILPSKTKILENGIFKMGLSDRFSAFKMGFKNTGNGRREDFKHKAYARMTTTYFENGNHTFDEILRSIDYGVFLDHFSLGMEDPKNWGIQITFNMGKEIKNGKFTGNIFSPVGLTGNVENVLNNVTMVGNNFNKNGGSCGKGHKEYVPNTTGGPSIKTIAMLV